MFKAMKLKVKKNKVLLIALILLIIFSLNFFQENVKGFFYSISSPIQVWFWQAGDSIADFFSIIPKALVLEKENEKLNMQNLELLAEINSLKEIKEENFFLRDALMVGLEKDFRMEVAGIISKDIGQDSIIINKGSKDGLSKDMPVISGQKAVIGRIEEVYDNRSRILLISNKNSFFEAKISETETTGLLRGNGDGKALLDLLPKNENIKQGDLIVSSALSGLFPSGLLVGWVEEVEKGDADLFQKAKVSLFSRINNLEQVFIILDF
jgi:rod shape-determining protein MreC